jgi:hypothetical protein
MASRFGPYVSLTNLAFYIDPLNVKSYPGSGTTAYNLIDNQTATLSGVTTSGGAFSNAGSGVIAGTASYNLSLSGGYTLIQFMNLTSRQGGYFNYVSGSNSINLYSGGLTQMRWETYGSGGDIYSNTTIPTGVWHSWAGTFSGTGSAGGSGTSKIYYNGILDNSGTVSGATSNNATFQLGYQGGAMNGLLGPSLFWNRVLTDSEVRAVHVALKGRYGI